MVNERVFVFPLDFFRMDLKRLVFNDELCVRKSTDDDVDWQVNYGKSPPSFLRHDVCQYCLEVIASNTGEAVLKAYGPISSLRLNKRGSVGISQFMVPKEMSGVVAPLPPRSK